MDFLINMILLLLFLRYYHFLINRLYNSLGDPWLILHFDARQNIYVERARLQLNSLFLRPGSDIATV